MTSSNENYPRLDYLCPETGRHKKTRTEEGKFIYCFSDTTQRHVYHSNNLHLNTISDITFHILHNHCALARTYDLIFNSVFLWCKISVWICVKPKIFWIGKDC